MSCVWLKIDSMGTEMRSYSRLRAMQLSGLTTSDEQEHAYWLFKVLEGPIITGSPKNDNAEGEKTIFRLTVIKA